MIKTAIIGASGYIGSHLLAAYRQAFPDCIGTTFTKQGAGLMSFDLRHPNIEPLHLQETGHEAVIIASAMPNVGWCEAHPQESYELNVRGTLALVKALSQAGIMPIFLSSDYVFNGEAGGYLDSAPTSPITEYGRQKALVEIEIPNITDQYAIFRLSKIYGTRWQDNTLLDQMVAALLKGQQLSVATDQFFSPTHVDDVVAMALYTQQRGVKGLVNLCHSNSYSRYQLAKKLIEALDLSPSLIHAVHLHDIPSMENRPLNTSLKCSSILENLQSSLQTIDAAVARVIKNWQNADTQQHAVGA